MAKQIPRRELKFHREDRFDGAGRCRFDDENHQAFNEGYFFQ